MTDPLGSIGNILSDNPELYQAVLDNLPFGVSIQTKNRVIIYENKFISSLLGSYYKRYCYDRWNYLPDRENEIITPI